MACLARISYTVHIAETPFLGTELQDFRYLLEQNTIYMQNLVLISMICILLTQLSRLGANNLQNIPEDVREHIKLLLNVAPAVRPDADQMTKVSKEKGYCRKAVENKEKPS